MITSIFSKSRPINYILITVLMITCFSIYQFSTNYNTISNLEIGLKVVFLLMLIGSLFITNFITKKNGLSKDNSYTFLLFCIFFILFPTTLSNGNLILSNAFILLALRRLISLQSLITPKEKIFDASLWIFIASLFHFWSIIFILLVFISIIFHVSRDYRNWIIPFIALAAVAVITVLLSLIFDIGFLSKYIHSTGIDIDLAYIENVFQSFSLGVYILTSVVAFVTMLFILTNKPLNLQASYKKVIFAFILGLIVFFISPNKENSYLIFTFVPVAIMLTNYLETIEKYWIKESILGILFLSSLINYILRLL
ncbi:DUF6427 family protein [Flavobacterium amniphilum]|uniref:DUF6427 family protein n=1 Tax=Flavobacterium amniphilum TaxID=1834035 RepID=UPI00202AA15E|nr:DUF6427 family protein [Flavobacterium amniphilum]MCL9804089.1 DUF6427 family protein [Flavobacterium amniphilum]